MSDLAKREAVKLSEQVEAHSLAFARSGLVLARMLDECKGKGVPEAMGMDWPAWLERYCGHSLSDVRRKLQISRGFAGLPTKELIEMKESNAYELLRLPAAERTKKAWLDRAKDMTVAAFRGAVAKAAGQNGETDEDWATFTLKAPRSVVAGLREAELKVADMLGLDIERAGERIQVWEAVTGLIATTEREHLLIELKGGN